MSADVRTALAAAASSVDGLTGHPYYVQTTEPGHVWVRLDRIEYPNRFGGVAHWNVVLILPADLDASEQYLETHGPALRDALRNELVVTTITPQRIEIPGVGVLPCAFFNGHREE
jgi:hypothetical protein